MDMDGKLGLMLRPCLVLVIAGAAGCRSRVERETPFTQHVTEYEGSVYAFGMPELDEDWDHGPVVLIERPGYALAHSSTDKIPRWVCQRITKAELPLRGRDVDQKSARPDPALHAGERAERRDYNLSGYVKGYQAPPEDVATNQQKVEEAFFLSNAAPQVGRGFRRGIWAELERRVRECARDRGEVYVMTGGFFYDPNEENPTTADGVVEHRVIGRNKVAVPTHFYKIVVAQNDESEWESIAFVFENRRYDREREGNYDFRPFVRSIDWIEARTGIDFLPHLSANETLETKLEAKSSKLWRQFGQV
jgi:endonuclease G